MGDRHLAGTEAVDADAIFQFVQAHSDLGVELGGRNDHLEFALETFGQRFGNLHRSHTSLLGSALRRTFRNDGRSYRPLFVSTLGVVRAEGLEPPRLSSREPKSRASTNSATPAKGSLKDDPGAAIRQGLVAERLNAPRPARASRHSLPSGRRLISR